MNRIVSIGLSLYIAFIQNTHGFDVVEQQGITIAKFNHIELIGSQFKVPDQWDEIHIGRHVVVTGGWMIPASRTKPLVFRGADRDSSVLRGTGIGGPLDERDAEARRHSTIYSRTRQRVEIRNLSLLDPDKFHILGFSENPFHIENVTIRDNRRAETTDGIGGGDGTVIKNVLIDTHDDAIKIYHHNMHIEDVTIVHNENGSPIQLGWSGEDGSARIKNLTIIGNSQHYNMAIFTRASTKSKRHYTSTIHLDGLTVTTNPGAKTPPLIQWSRNIGRRPAGKIDNFTLKITGLCRDENIEAMFKNRERYWVTYHNSQFDVDAPDCQSKAD